MKNVADWPTIDPVLSKAASQISNPLAMPIADPILSTLPVNNHEFKRCRDTVYHKSLVVNTSTPSLAPNPLFGEYYETPFGIFLLSFGFRSFGSGRWFQHMDMVLGVDDDPGPVLPAYDRVSNPRIRQNLFHLGPVVRVDLQHSADDVAGLPWQQT
jgi:hypothetical protein